MNDFITGLEEMQNRKVDVKIEQGKHYFLKGVTKSGVNNYQNFNYLELYDILPIVRKICTDLKMKTRVDFTDNIATLVITDCEDNSSAYFTCPLAPVHDEDPGRYMQNIGRVRTYAMRYLYIQAFEIAVPDQIDKNSKPAKTQSKNQYKKQSHNSYTKTIPEREIHDLARNIAEEMNSQGIPDTTENSLEYIKQKWQKNQITPQEYRQLKEKLGSAV